MSPLAKLGSFLPDSHTASCAHEKRSQERAAAVKQLLLTNAASNRSAVRDWCLPHDYACREDFNDFSDAVSAGRNSTAWTIIPRNHPISSSTFFRTSIPTTSLPTGAVLCKTDVRTGFTRAEWATGADLPSVQALRRHGTSLASSLLLPCVASLYLADGLEACCMPSLSHLHATRLLAPPSTPSAVALLASKARTFDIKCPESGARGCRSLCCGQLFHVYQNITNGDRPRDRRNSTSVQTETDLVERGRAAHQDPAGAAWVPTVGRCSLNSTSLVGKQQDRRGKQLLHTFRADAAWLNASRFSTDFSLAVTIFEEHSADWADDPHCVRRECGGDAPVKTVCFDVIDYLHQGFNAMAARSRGHGERNGLRLGDALEGLLASL